MNFTPCNRYILIEEVDLRSEGEEDKVCVLVPDDYKVEPLYGCYRVLDFSEDCSIGVLVDDNIVVQNSMIETLDIEGGQHMIVLENYVVGVYYEEETNV